MKVIRVTYSLKILHDIFQDLIYCFYFLLISDEGIVKCK
jgi:hypothetical protein